MLLRSDNNFLNLQNVNGNVSTNYGNRKLHNILYGVVSDNYHNIVRQRHQIRHITAR